MHRSVSQLQQYTKCPMAYKLSRIDKVWQRPAAWLIQGSAVHEAIEAWEKSGRTMTLEEATEDDLESYNQMTLPAMRKMALAQIRDSYIKRMLEKE